jgi:serine/threonine protein kinase
MMRWLGDATVSHLRDVAEWPDLGERYEVTGRLGRGGMGVVYLAWDRALAREVAVKVTDGVVHDSDAAERLRAEAQILGRLEHPGIVPVHDLGALADGRIFYVMTRVRGARLDEALTADTSTAERLEIFHRICDAVSFAHAQGIVHRDLTPANVMLGPFGEVLVMDWGVAKVLDGRKDDAIVGTPGFMAPEQSAGNADAVDARADVFALGAILQAMLPAAPPKPLAAIATRAQAVDVDGRYPSVDALARDLGRFRNGEPVEAYPESIVERIVRIYRRYEVPVLLVVAYMIMRVILLLWLRI